MTRRGQYGQMAVAGCLGLALRLFYAFRFPFWAGDTNFYEELARNWLYHGCYGLYVSGWLLPVDQRMPGYPAFLSGIYAVFGQTRTAVMLAQAIVDLGACFLIAALASRIALHESRRRARVAAFWLAAVCSFTANYTAAILSESLAIFFSALAMLVIAGALNKALSETRSAGVDARGEILSAKTWLLAGFVVGLGTFVRPEMPLLLAALALILIWRWWRPKNWKRLLLAGAWLAVGLLLPLEPWAIRNARTLGRIEFLSPVYAQAQGDYIARGFYAWTKTWMVEYRDAYTVMWKLGKQPIPLEAIPTSAFDSSGERERVASLLAQYNSTLQLPPLLDSQFARLSRERTARHPLRTYLLIPLRRAWNIWFTPRVELLPVSGEIFPLTQLWQSNRCGLLATLGLGLLCFVYVGMALAGAWRMRACPAIQFLVAYAVLRTVFLTQMPTVEPRYVIECFPAIIALAAQCWAAKRDSLLKARQL